MTAHFHVPDFPSSSYSYTPSFINTHGYASCISIMISTNSKLFALEPCEILCNKIAKCALPLRRSFARMSYAYLHVCTKHVPIYADAGVACLTALNKLTGIAAATGYILFSHEAVSIYIKFFEASGRTVYACK